jgi:hypothetical protein
LLQGGLNSDGSINAAGVLHVQSSGAVFETRPPTIFAAATGSVITADFGTAISFTNVTSAVPEPSTWAMLIAGFGFLGFVGYRKTRSDNALA